jgi:lipid-A-disaccharide synthase
MVSAGEASGDLHGAALIRAAGELRPSWSFFGLGGDLMEEAGAGLSAHMRDTAVMGINEVAAALPRILRVRSKMLSLIETERPDCLVLIDSPDFNFRLAKAAKAAKVPVVYYICPTVWAWRSGRLKFLSDYADARALIFGFEAEFYRERGVDCDFVGNPILDELPESFDKKSILESLGLGAEARVLALLPGSRPSVAKRLAPPMLEAAGMLLEEFGDLKVVVPRAPTLPEDLLGSLISEAPPRVKESLIITSGRSQEILALCRAALLASGTSTVEGAVLGAPMVVAWRFSLLTWWLAKLLVKSTYAAMANIVAGSEIVPELLQGRARPELMFEALAPLIRGGEARQRMLSDLAKVKEALGGPGASKNVVGVIARVMGEGREP